MGTACTECLGRSWVLVDGKPEPCPTCQPTTEDAANAAQIAERLAQPERRNTVEVMDGSYRPGMEDERGTDAIGAGFSQAEVAAQNAKDIAAMRSMGRR